MVRRALLGLGLAAAAIAVIVGYRAATLESRQFVVEAAPRIALDEQTLAERLARAVRIRTLSVSDQEPVSLERAQEFAALLEELFPRVHRRLKRESLDGSLLFVWPGADPDAEGLLFAAHLDVVPVEASTEAAWTQHPFAGSVADDAVWGRGALDDKAGLLALLEAAELLIEAGFEPRRTLYFAFGHDEELGGEHGAAAIAARLAERGVRLQMVLDEGGCVSEGVIDGIAAPVALIGVAEKGYLSLELTVSLPGGHSSMPPAPSAVEVLTAGLSRLNAAPFPARLSSPVRAMLDHLAPHMPLASRLALANLWLGEPFVRAIMAKKPATNAALRTTQAVTILEAGVKDNVVPGFARAVVNFRIVPGETVDSVTSRVREVVRDERISLVARERRDPSPLSPIEGENCPFPDLARAVRAAFPDSLVTPFLVPGGTDARHYAALSPHLYRFTPWRLTQALIEGIHGVNERLPIAAYADGVRFYRLLFVRLAR